MSLSKPELGTSSPRVRPEASRDSQPRNNKQETAAPAAGPTAPKKPADTFEIRSRGEGLPMIPRPNLVAGGDGQKRPKVDPSFWPLPKTSGETRSVKDALADAGTLLTGPKLNEKTPQGSTVVAFPEAPNSEGDARTSARGKAAAAQVLANGALEKQSLGKLDPEQRQQYADVKAKLGDDPVAQLALQKVLFEGKLTGSRDLLRGEDDVLSGLAKMSTEPLDKGIDARRLVSDTVQEVACPESISQRDRGTCGGTAVGIQLAREQPAEYVRLVSGLASRGWAKTVSGHLLRRVDGTQQPDGTDRSTSQRLLSPALMDTADGWHWHYDNKTDYTTSDKQQESMGLSPGNVDRLLETVYGKPFSSMNKIESSQQQQDAWNVVNQQVGQGKSVLAGLQWTDKLRHKVVVLGVDKANGQESVVFQNPWGRMERMPKDEFLRRLRNVNYGGAAGSNG